MLQQIRARLVIIRHPFLNQIVCNIPEITPKLLHLLRCQKSNFIEILQTYYGSGFLRSRCVIKRVFMPWTLCFLMPSQSLRKLANDFLNLVNRSIQLPGNLICGIMQFRIIDLNHPFQFSLCKAFFSALVLNLV